MSEPYFVETNCNPSGERFGGEIYSSVNAVTIATGLNWRDVVKSLADQCHMRASMPSYRVCRTDMLRVNGFRPLKLSTTLPGFLKHLESLSDRKRYIIHLNVLGYFAVIPDESGKYTVRGLAFGVQLSRCSLSEIWEYNPGNNYKTGISHKTDPGWIPEDSLRFHGKNLNPEGKIARDCVIRALAGVMNCSWHEAFDLLYTVQNYAEPILNRTSNISLTLSKLGFIHHKTIVNGGKPLSGEEFCALMSHTYRKGERIFAFSGKNHCIAVLPELQNDGTYSYAVQDSWDSSSRPVLDFWVYSGPAAPAPDCVKAVSLSKGEKLHHPGFGDGTVINVTTSGGITVVEVDFGSSGIRKLSESWLRKSLSDGNN